MLRVAVTGSSHPAGVEAEGFDMVVAGSHKDSVPGAVSHRVAVDPCMGGVAAADCRDLVDSSHLGRVLVDLAEHRQEQNHRIVAAAVAAAAAAGLEAYRNPGVGRPGVERNRSSRFQTLSKVYRGKIVLLDRERETEKFNLEEGGLCLAVGKHRKCGVII